jgi:hypothetical protein
MALSPAEQRRVWEALYVCEVRNNYYARLSGRYQKTQVALTWLMLFLSGGAAFSFVTKISTDRPLVPPLLSIATAAISAYSLLAKKERKGIDASRLSQKYAQIGHAFDVMFGRMDLTSSDELQKLEEKKTDLGEAGHSLSNSRRLMRCAERDVKKARGL